MSTTFNVKRKIGMIDSTIDSTVDSTIDSTIDSAVDLDLADLSPKTTVDLDPDEAEQLDHQPDQPAQRIHRENADHRATRRAICSSRYQDRGVIGSGGMGEVHRVFDAVLGREVAMKLIHPRIAQDEVYESRFCSEARVLASLQHPNILPIYDFGALDDGKLYFTMLEVKGESLTSYIRRVHAESDQSGWGHTKDGWSLTRLLSALCDISKAITYAHERGVIHRDLKPDNVIIGSMGEVIIVDWGLAYEAVELRDGQAQEVGGGAGYQRDSAHSSTSKPSVLAGTPPYLAPELVYGAPRAITPHNDIYSLGVMLYEALHGEKPALPRQIPAQLNAITSGGLIRFNESLSDGEEGGGAHPIHEDDKPNQLGAVKRRYSSRGAPLPYELTQLCLDMTSTQVERRPQSAREVTRVLQRWLDGSARREQALKLIASADPLRHSIDEMKSRVVALRAQAATLARNVEPWQSHDHKSELWTTEDRVEQLESLIELTSFQLQSVYHTALLHKPDLNEAHHALALLYRAEHQRAEGLGDQRAAQKLALRIESHVSAISGMEKTRRSISAYLAGTAEVTINVHPSASISRAEFELRDRRLILSGSRVISEGSLRDHELSPGSYMFTLERPGYHPARYPIYNRRGDNVTGLDPDGARYEVTLLPQGELAIDDCYVPGGWAILGGDQATPNSLPEQRIWVDSFVIKRFPVTHGEYIVFLNDLLSDEGGEARALLLAPREEGAMREGERSLNPSTRLYELTPDGFRLSASATTHELSLSHPVTQVTWDAARAYARWLSERTQRSWRLPLEYEWEKAARGVDGRGYPWGEHHDPSWSCMKDSHIGTVHIHEVGSFVTDESVYGVRDTAGNVRDWCLDRFREEGAPLKNQRLLFPSDADLADRGFKSTRGGSYGNSATRARCADRDWWFPDRGYVGRGFRLARSV